MNNPPTPDSNRVRSRRTWSIATAIFLLGATLASILIGNQRQNRLHQERAEAALQVADYAQALETTLAHALSVTHAMAALVRHGRGTVEDFDTLAAQLLPSYPGASVLILAPDGIIRHVVPLIGNEKALGLDLLQDPVMKKEASLARDSGKLVLAGPLNLVQGGQGVIGRLPVFIEDDTGKSAFWGFSNVVMRLPQALAGARLPQLLERGLEYQLWRIHPDSGQRQIIAASTAAALVDPVHHALDLPYGNWTLSAAPRQGWSSGLWLTADFALGLLFSLLLAFLAKLLLESRIHEEELEGTVVQRTADILASKNQLAAMIEAIPDPMWELGLDGRCYGCHSWPVEALATFMLELIGHKVSEKFPAAAAETIMTALTEAHANGSSHGKEIELHVGQDDLWFELSVACKAAATSDEDRFIVLARDITERKRAEALERRRRDDLLAMYLLSNTVSNAESIERVYEEAMDSLLRMLKADRASILRLDADGVMRFKAWRNLSETYRQSAEEHSPWPADVVNPKPVLVADVERDPALTQFRPAAIAEGLRALGYIPLTQHGHLLGRFMIYFNAPHDFAEDELQLATTIASHVAVAIARKSAETELRIAATAFESQEGMLITDANNVILQVNQAFTEMTGYTVAEAVGQTPRLLRSERHDPAFYAAMWKDIEQTGVWQGELWNRRKNGEVFPSWLTITAVKGPTGAVTHYVGSQLDITARKAAEERIEHLAFFDTLTDLPNRRLQADRLQQAMAASVRSRKHGALMFLDLDNFKTLNETLGHEIGDLLLQQVAQRLLGCVRKGDTVARIGGDEFVVILQELSDKADEAASQAEAIGEKIRDALGASYMLAGQPHLSTPSIGVTLFGDASASYDDLMKQADLALYQAKAAGRNTLRFFDPEMQTMVLARARLDADLREAVLQKQFVLHYQPQVDATAGVIGAEALLRWQHPGRGLVLPSEFISRAEDTGLILTLGHWALKTAIAQLASWASRPETAHLILAVNVSVHQFGMPDFVDDVLNLLDQSGADPRKLKLELTESLLMVNADEVIAKMTALKARGVSFSLDDFGTGYSSLAYLKRLPLTQLKIDQSFVRDVATNPGDAVIANAIIALANSMGMSVIAEGVETEEHRYFLGSHGCQVYQGYLFSAPLPLEDFQRFVDSYVSSIPETPLVQF